MITSLLLSLLLALTPQAATAPAAPQTPAAPAVPAAPTRAQLLRGEYGKARSNNDLLYYHLDVKIDPATKTVAGKNTIKFRMLNEDTKIQIDLWANLNVDKILMGTTPLKYERELNAVFITFPAPIKPGREVSIDFYYSGTPTQTGRFGGFTFGKDPAGRPWVFTACEGEGSSIWFPSKDQWRDEVESMDISVAVPSNLTNVSNGRFISKKDVGGGFTQFNYRVHYPINSYNVSVNIGAYAHFSDTAGPVTLDFYALPEDLDKAKAQFAQAKPMIQAFEHYFGEYPFVRDGYKLIQVPYTGMEHQSAVTYGNGFKNGYGGRDWTGVGVSPKFDFIIIHESAHEWFGNAVSASDVSDMWIQEGWCTYLEMLYVEQVFGASDALKYINGYKTKVQNQTPVIRTRGRHEGPQGNDQYFKGALFLHTLRNVMNDDAKWWALVRETYNTFKYKNILTEEMVTLFTSRFGKNMTPVFNQYLRRTALPTLELLFEDANGKVSYRWKADEAAFAMPIRVGDKNAWQTITPTTSWQTMDTKLKKDAFDVATDLYYVNVTKADKTGELPANPPAPAARVVSPEQAAFDEATKIKDLAERLPVLRKIQADYPTSSFLRQVNSVVLNILIGLPDKRADVGAAFAKVATDITTNAAYTPDTQLLLLVSPVARALDLGFVIDGADTTLAKVLSSATNAAPSARASGLELNARLLAAKGDAAGAEKAFRDALALDPTLKSAPIGLAKILAARNDTKTALTYYLQAAAAGTLKGDDEKAFRALYLKANGSEKNLEADIDRAFHTAFPNPVEPEKWRPTPARTSRLVLAELFTGSACPPCVAADYALEAAMERYPSVDMATLVYHVHVPGPDPMTTAASVARKDYYKEYVLGVPTFIVDGGLARLGGGGRDNTGPTYGVYASFIDAAMNTAPGAALALKTELKNGKVSVSTSISNLAAAYKDAKGLTLHVALAEQELTFGGENGMRFHPLVVRAMAGGDKPGLPVTMDASGKVTLGAVFDLSTIPADVTSSLEAEIKKRRGNEAAGSTPAVYKAEGHAYTKVDPSKLIVVAFLQDADKRVLQAVQKPLNAGAWRKGEKR
jgi:tetratricopeptide (TPR) repeat protein